MESSWYKYCQRELLFVMLSWIVTISKARTYENDAHAAKTSPAALSILVIHHLQFEITYSKPYIYLFFFFGDFNYHFYEIVHKSIKVLVWWSVNYTHNTLGFA